MIGNDEGTGWGGRVKGGRAPAPVTLHTRYVNTTVSSHRLPSSSSSSSLSSSSFFLFAPLLAPAAPSFFSLTWREMSSYPTVTREASTQLRAAFSASSYRSSSVAWRAGASTERQKL
jgi:hypothetical protein